ncbi:hypothetical protein A2982_01355 [candidate division WWE3 bacterium RIFCSPLOWO2_01_FULL_39_13]|uniref:Nudix hydrolase domain-containing protein n=1 Tax=candidate division WWE3 bacterium RIFCSPLOWO2_01_FULL_39_13 TaxID=1802624 RepID=A0A1F4V4I9_UNCKA|nr:MAG: hypothetical protein A2982_01355 [candidate division WWE3 bacterium RIFCSPLOWO2_01_FULL_39_13]
MDDKTLRIVDIPEEYRYLEDMLGLAESQTWTSAGILPVMPDGKVVLGSHRYSGGQFGEYWGPITGKREPIDRFAWETATRETGEELGLHLKPTNLGRPARFVYLLADGGSNFQTHVGVLYPVAVCDLTFGGLKLGSEISRISAFSIPELGNMLKKWQLYGTLRARHYNEVWMSALIRNWNERRWFASTDFHYVLRSLGMLDSISEVNPPSS